MSLGIAAGYVYAVGLALAVGLPPLEVAVLLTAGGLVAAALALLTPLVTGFEVFTFYHYQIAVLAACAALLSVRGRPLLPYLDLLILTLGLVQAIGRWGCFMAGCCHGRPHRFGVRYRGQHAEQGFQPALVGVRLFPIQLVESLCLLGLVGIGSAQLVVRRPAGEPFITYVLGYGAIRFLLELVRGDAARPHRLGFSEAQWTAMAGVAAAAAGELTGLLPLRPWHLAIATLMAVGAATLAWSRRRDPDHLLTHPRHVAEIASLADHLAAAVAARPARVGWAGKPVVHMGRTTLGLRLSASGLSATGRCTHYALSMANGEMSERTARRLARLIVLLKHPEEQASLLPGRPGIFHLRTGVPADF